MIDASPLILAAAAVLWHPASSPEPPCRCERPGEQWLYAQADPVRLAPGARAASVSDGSRLFVATTRPSEMERARWLVASPGDRAYWAEATAPSAQLMTRGAHLLLPTAAGKGRANARVQTRRVSYPGGFFADALSVAAGSRLEFDLPTDRQILLELIDPDGASGSSQVSVGWDSGALSTRTVTWPSGSATAEPRLQRVLLSPPVASRRLQLVALDDVVLRVLAQRWRSAASDLGPAVSYWDPSADDAIARARDNGVDPAARWQVAQEQRATRQSFFRSLLPSGSGSGVRLQWDGYRSLAADHKAGPGESPGAETEMDAEAEGEMDGMGGVEAVAGAGRGARQPWLTLGRESVDFELPIRSADSMLRVRVRGPAGELRIQLEDEPPLPLELRARGPMDRPEAVPADGSARLLLPAGTRRIRIVAVSGQALEIALAYRTARSYRLSESAYRELLASTDAATLLRHRLAQSPARRSSELDAAPSADQELLNHWAALLRRLPEATLRTRLAPSVGACIAASPASAPGPLGRRLLAQQALFGCASAQRQAGWDGLSARADRADDDLAVAVAALVADGRVDHWRWLAEALQRHGWHLWSQDVARVAGLAAPDLPPPAGAALLAQASAAGAVPVQSRGSDRLGWAWRASQSQPLTLAVPAGSRRVELTVRPLPGAQEQWLPVRLDGADIAVLALPRLAWSSDLLDARTRRPLPAAARVALDLPAGARELVFRPTAADVLITAAWLREPAGTTQGPVAMLDPPPTASGRAWATRYHLDQSGQAQTLLALLRAAADSEQDDPSEPESLDTSGDQAARALAWARPGHWERLAVPEGGAGYRDLPAAPTVGSGDWASQNALLPAPAPGDRLLRSGQTLRGRVPAAGHYRLTSRWHELFPSAPANLVGTWGELPVGQASRTLVLAGDIPWQLELASTPEPRQAIVRIERVQAGRWRAVEVAPVLERWWIATRNEPILVYWPEPGVVRVTTARSGGREIHWELVTPDRPLRLSPASNQDERLLQVHLWQPGPTRTPQEQPGPSADPWRPRSAIGGAAPAPGQQVDALLPVRRWTDAVTAALMQRPEAEDAAASAPGSASWQLGWQRYRHLPGQHAFAGLELVTRTSAGQQAVGGSAFYDWQPPASIWSASIETEAWLTQSRSVWGLRATGRADWAYGARWDHQISVSGQVWQGPATALSDGLIWSSYRASHRRAVTLEDRWRWWVSPASHGLARLQWRSNEDLSRDQGSAWLGWQVASGRWSAATEVGLRWQAADADRLKAARKPALRFGLDFWHPVSSRNGVIASLGLLLGENRADQSVGLELTWFRHEGRGMDDFSPRRFRFLELRQGQFMEDRP